MLVTRRDFFQRMIQGSRDGVLPGYENHFCRYLTTDGHKCAFGLFLPDSHPAQHCHGMSAETLLDRCEDLRKELVGEVTVLDYQYAQKVHDRLVSEGWSHAGLIQGLINKFPDDAALIRELAI